MTLTETSKLVRKGVVIFWIVVVTYYLSILIFIPVIKKSFAHLFPEKDPATPIFGNLPPLEFTQKKLKTDTVPTFKLDTKDGKLPNWIPKKLTVYKLKKPVVSFEKGKDAISTAGTLGFTDDDLTSSLKDTIYKWRSLKSSGLLEINTNTQALSLNTPIAGLPDYFPRGELYDDLVKKYANELLGKIKRDYDPLYKSGWQTITYGKFTGSTIVKTTTLSDAQIARIDYFRKIGDYPIYGPDPKDGLIYFFVRKQGEQNPYYNFPIGASTIWDVVTPSSATYPILPVEEVWKFIEQNRGVMVNITPQDGSNLRPYSPITVESIFINNIYLAYYDTPTFQEYLQPIYVFEGKYTTTGTKGGTITLYYPAVMPQYINPVK